LVELLEIFEHFPCAFDIGHYSNDTFVEDGQQHFALGFLGLFDDAVVETDDGCQKFIVTAHLGHEFIEELEGADDGLVVTDLDGARRTSVKRMMTRRSNDL
jgi:hypothetical protein